MHSSFLYSHPSGFHAILRRPTGEVTRMKLRSGDSLLKSMNRMNAWIGRVAFAPQNDIFSGDTFSHLDASLQEGKWSGHPPLIDEHALK